MKKWLVIILFLLVVLLTCIYFLIPKSFIVNESISVKENSKGIIRSIMDEKTWINWWPGRKDSLDQFSFQLNDYKYSIIDKRVNSLVISISKNQDVDTTQLNILPVSIDSVIIQWDTRLLPASKVFPRIGNYAKGKLLKKDFKYLLEEMKKFYSKKQNIYGLEIREGKVTDSILLQNSAISKGKPTTEFIYSLIDGLNRYLISQSAKQTGFPMLNVSARDSINYLVKVAIPVDKELPDSGNLVFRRMLGGGKILSADIKGGPYLIQKGFEIFDEYMNDHSRLSPAIPFQSLLNDRRMEKDTSKWMTRIYFPVI